MRLLSTARDSQNLIFKEFHGDAIPPYAILSHCWGDEEVSHREAQEANKRVRRLSGFLKIQEFRKLARTRGYLYCWINTCCIDKTSSADLSEAINSMFGFYKRVGLCVTYLQGVQERQINPGDLKMIKEHRIFTRGWTLQELIACPNRLFVNDSWEEITLNETGTDMLQFLSTITRIPVDVLRRSMYLDEYCVAQKMSWAARRETTRPEDWAYSLMGIFGINMPVLYGEGFSKAFRRLQEAIMLRTADQSLFAWRGSYKQSGLLARSPADFELSGNIRLDGIYGTFAMTNLGIFP